MADDRERQEWLPAVRVLDQDRRRIEARLAGPLPTSVEAALRAERRWIERRRGDLVRRPVSCEARLDLDVGTFVVRLQDVSAGGALLEIDDPPEVGLRAQLRVPTLPGAPAVGCVVRHASRPARRAGVEFTGADGSGARLAALLARALPAGAAEP